LPILQLEFEHRLAVLDAGVVDEDVNGRSLVVEALEGRPYRRFVGNVEGRTERIDAGRAELADGRFDGGGLAA
jgi:hypothetical protein